jgi:phosphocarrier protein
MPGDIVNTGDQLMPSDLTVTRTVVVSNAMGLHARPAAQLVHLANRFKSDLKLYRAGEGGREADCRSVLAMLMLAACKDTELELRASGEDAADAVETLAGYFDRNFDEK